ncbi:UDP-Glycosyltransferase superfamily protein [Striga asiatica]|uniref:UDP-Glycosyltransferase superfamily protein n=1 Tax=Striga asiatica TaxID=4170 RepID=A0A5A7PR96_STRAF|nr:UDP-Glycosyltransferase superfamily protein [Striga asiatica]
MISIAKRHSEWTPSIPSICHHRSHATSRRQFLLVGRHLLLVDSRLLMFEASQSQHRLSYLISHCRLPFAGLVRTTPLSNRPHRKQLEDEVENRRHADKELRREAVDSTLVSCSFKSRQLSALGRQVCCFSHEQGLLSLGVLEYSLVAGTGALGRQFAALPRGKVVQIGL